MSAAAAAAAAATVSRRLPRPKFGNTLYELLVKLPNNGVGSRVAPITWAINNQPNSYYTITTSKISYVEKLTRAGYPLRLEGGQVVVADDKWSAAQFEKARSSREEHLRAARAGEEEDGFGEDVEEGVDEGEEGERRLTEEERRQAEIEAGVLKPKGEAWGWGVWDGQPDPNLGSQDAPKLILEDALKHKWREVSDETQVEFNTLAKMMKKAHPRAVHKIV